VDPPSPSEDPLLLKGVDLEVWLEKKGRRPLVGAMEVEVQQEVNESPGQARVQRGGFFGFGIAGAEREAHFDNVDGELEGEMPVFDLEDVPNDVGSGWDSDDDSAYGDGEGEGEYTGKWKMMTVPTKSTPEKGADWENRVDLRESVPEALSSKVCVLLFMHKGASEILLS
jgi:hypothetical protein